MWEHSPSHVRQQGAGRSFHRDRWLLLLYCLAVVPAICLCAIALFGFFSFMGGHSSTSMAHPVVVSATAKHTATVIFLHGLGDTGHGWAASFASVKIPHVKYVCPTASTMPVTLNAGFKMPSWFDLLTLEPNGPEDVEGIKKAASSVHHLIEQEEKNGIPSNRIFVGGFSQGGALAMYSAFRYEKPLAGIIALSCWMPLNKQFPDVIIGNKDTPVIQCHGDIDPVVQFKWGAMTSELLKTTLPNHEFKTYPGMMHNSNEEEMQDVKAFILKHAPAS